MSKKNVGNKTGIMPRGGTVYKVVKYGYGRCDCIPGCDYAKCDGYAIVEMITLENGVVPVESRKDCASEPYRKCRVPAVYVVSLVDKQTGASVVEGYSDYNNTVKYRAGEVVRSNGWDSSEDAVCTNGIHVFHTRKEAMKYSL